jgi:hypothetical protein
LVVIDTPLPKDPGEALDALSSAPAADLYNVTSFMSDELISLLYSGADAVLANSGHEPFGLVGLEVMAAGGVAFVGCTGEDYAVPYLNSVALDTDDPSEITIALDFLRTHPEVAARIRADAQETARSFSWENVITDSLVGKLEYVAMRQLVSPPTRGPLNVPPEPKVREDADGSQGRHEPLPYGGESVGRRLPVKPRSTSTSRRTRPPAGASADTTEAAVDDPGPARTGGPPTAPSGPKTKRKPAR